MVLGVDPNWRTSRSLVIDSLPQWVFITGGCSRRGVQWMGVVLHSKAVHNTIQITTPCFHCTPPLMNLDTGKQVKRICKGKRPYGLKPWPGEDSMFMAYKEALARRTRLFACALNKKQADHRHADSTRWLPDGVGGRALCCFFEHRSPMEQEPPAPTLDI